MLNRRSKLNQAGAVPVPLLIALVAVIAFLAVFSAAPVKNSLFTALYPKKSSFAETANDGVPCSLPPGSQGPGLCTGFNEVAPFTPEMKAMQTVQNDIWDTQIASEDLIGVKTTDMDTGCQQIGDPTTHHMTLTDRDMMSMMCGAHMMSAINGGLESDTPPKVWVGWRGRSQFDFTNRTGNLIFTADLRESTRQWIELYITPTDARYPGDNFLSDWSDQLTTGIRFLYQTNNLKVQRVTGTNVSDITSAPLIASTNNNRNHVIIQLSTTHVKVTEDGPTTPVTVLVDSNINPPLSFSKGNVLFNHRVYNWHKDCSAGSPIFAMDCTLDTVHWDNMGWDGPVTNFSVASTSSNQILHADSGHIEKVTLNHATGGSGKLWFSTYNVNTTNGQYRLNNGAWKTIPRGKDCGFRTFAFPESFVQGANTVEFHSVGTMGTCFGDQFRVQRIDLEVPLAAGSTPAPSASATPTPTPTATPIPSPSPSPTPIPSPSKTPTPSPSATPLASPSPSAKPGDIDGNNKVDIFDYNILLTNFGKTGTNLGGDFDHNNKVDIFDYNILLSNFGH